MGLVPFSVDTTTLHPGVIVGDNGVISRETNGGWVTLRTTAPLSVDRRQWGIKILDQGEGNDGSGLMVGLLPRVPAQQVSSMGSKYISELGGWCISRAGESYGAWKCDRMPFATGSVLEFDIDVGSKTLYVVCGKERAVAHLPGLTEDEPVYPAVSMYYLNQKVIFV
jgi:hypothetical protein